MPRNESSTGTRKRLPRILIIDDERPLLDALVVSLERHLNAAGETDAPRALARLLEGELFDVILCDVRMPGMTGVQFHQALVATLPGHASGVIFMSGGVPQEMVDYLTALPNKCLEKPVNPDEIVDLVRVIQEHRTGS